MKNRKKKKQYYGFGEIDATPPNNSKWNPLTISLKGRA